MSSVTFTDGVEFNTAGDYRIERKSDGLYVVGNGLLEYVDSYQEGQEVIASLKKAIKKRKEPFKGYINFCGRLSLRTGKNQHFNMLTDWDAHHTLVLFVNEDGNPRVVGGCGEYEEGDRMYALGAQTHREYGVWEVVDCVPCTKEGMQSIKELIDSSSVLCGTWD